MLKTLSKNCLIRWLGVIDVTKFLLYEMSWVEAKEYFAKNDVAILPVGSTEQHGPQNPLGTDHLVARALAEEAAKQTGVLCLPVVPFGVSSHHRQFWGTTHVSPSVFRAYVREVCLSLKHHGVKKVVAVNGHGGNRSSLLELARELREQGMFMSVFQWWEVAGKLLPDLFDSKERGHAGAEETSMNLALHPRLVEMTKAVDEKVGCRFVESAGVSYGLDTVDYTVSGVFGVATTASAEKGKKVFEASVGELVKHIEYVKKLSAEDLLPKSCV